MIKHICFMWVLCFSGSAFAGDYCASFYRNTAYGISGYFTTYCTNGDEIETVKLDGFFPGESALDESREFLKTELASYGYSFWASRLQKTVLIFSDSDSNLSESGLCLVVTEMRAFNNVYHNFRCSGGFNKQLKDDPSEDELNDFIATQGYEIIADFGKVKEVSIYKSSVRLLHK